MAGLGAPAINNGPAGGGATAVNITQVGGATLSLGQQLAAASLPVVLTAAQVTTLTPPAAITNYALESGGNLASIKTDVDKIPSLGQALAAGSVPVVLTAAQLATLTPTAAITNYALETGGNLATITGIVTSARAAVNPISGQAGVQGASGVVTALTQRVVLATDVALPTGSNVIGHVIADTGSTTAVTQATASNLNATVVGTGTFAAQVTGSVTANAGTNLNTSTLALESGGNLATVAGIVTSARAAVNLISGQAGIAAGVGATGATVPRVVIANDTGRTLVSAGGSAASNGNNTLVAAGTNRLKVYAFVLSTLSTTAMTCIFQSGAGGTELWRVVLQAPTSTSTGANIVVQPPAWLFATASATLLNLNLSSANAVNWSVAYFDEA